MHTIRRLQGSLAVARRIPGERRVAFREPERIAELRDRSLRALVRYAADTVPHYRELFRTERIDSGEIRTAADLDRLPLVTKQDVQRDPRRFVSESRAGREAVLFHTSGSTGVPLDIYHDRSSLLANIPYSERERAVEAHFAGKRVRYSAVGFGHRRTATMMVQRFYAEATLRPVRPGIAYMFVSEPLEEIVGELNRRRPDVIRGSGTYFEALFRRIDAYGLHFIPPKVVVCVGDGITTEGKALIEERFGARVIERYAAIESLKIAFTCEQRAAYHLHDDLCHVRFVDGELVLTNLVNRGTVLINYRIGDLGRAAGGQCACGRGLPLLAGLEGRVSTVMELPNGALVHSIVVWGVLREYPGVLQFQLVQDAPDSFELRLVTVDTARFEQIAAAAVPRVRELLAGARVEATRHDELYAEEGRKFATVVPLRKPAL